MNLNHALLQTPRGADQATRAAGHNPALAAALDAIPAYVQARERHARLVADVTRIPDPPSDADLAADLIQTPVDQGRHLPKDVVQQVATALEQRTAYLKARDLLTGVASTLLQQRSAAVSAGANTGLTHLRGVLEETVATLSDLRGIPADPREAGRAGRSEQWQEREKARETLRLVRDAQRILSTAALAPGGEALPDTIGQRWEHLAYTPHVEKLWKPREHLAHYLTRGYLVDNLGNRKTLTAPYPGAGEHDAWADLHASGRAAAWLPTVEQLQTRAAELTAIAATVQQNTATKHLGRPGRVLA